MADCSGSELPNRRRRTTLARLTAAISLAALLLLTSASQALAFGFITQWGGAGSGNGKFNFPDAVAADAGANIYVADFNHNLVQKFTSAGTFLTQWGGSGSGMGKFNTPTALQRTPLAMSTSPTSATF